MVRSPFRGHTQHDIRDHNAMTVLELIRDFGPLSRIDIVRLTGLSKATVSLHVRDFEEMGVVVSAGTGEAAAGPKPKLLKFKSDFRHVIGFDLSDIRFEAALVDLKGQIYGKAFTGNTASGRAGILDSICPTIDQFMEIAERDGLKLGGIGIAISGLVDYYRGIIHRSTVFDITDMPLQAEIERRYGLPVRIDGDVNVRLVAEESRDEKGWSNRNVIYVYVGTGVGAGFYFDGAIFRGTSGLVGEIGHIPVVPDGPLCACGRKGCLEAVASWPAFVRRARDLGFGGGKDITAQEIVQAAEAGDEIAIQACAETADYLGLGLAVLANLLNPDLIVVGGKIAEFPGLFYPLLRESLHKKALEPVVNQVELSFASILTNAGVKGTPGLLLPVIREALTQAD